MERQRDRALEQLEKVATIPNGVTYGDLRFNPCWDSLRGDLRFDKIVAAAKAVSKALAIEAYKGRLLLGRQLRERRRIAIDLLLPSISFGYENAFATTLPIVRISSGKCHALSAKICNQTDLNKAMRRTSWCLSPTMMSLRKTPSSSKPNRLLRLMLRILMSGEWM
jgi:hypothetical protein